MHDTRPAAPDRSCLYDVASTQAGYFTAAQARSCGYSYQLLRHHSLSGWMVHAARGLYRLSEYPSSRHEDVVASWLRAGGTPAVVSHESALELLGLSDVIPDAVHLTVPRNMRYRRYLAGVVVHTTTRNPERSELVTVEGLPTTSASRSILDAAETGLGPEQVIAAVHDAIGRGMVSPPALEEAATARGARVARLVRRSLGTSPG